GCQEVRVQPPEDHPDHDQADNHRQRTEIALGNAASQADQVEALRGRGALGGRRLSGDLAHSGSSSASSPNSAPVIAATTCSRFTLRTSRLATRRPRYRTTMRSQTSNTSARLWLMTTTPRPCERSVLIRSSTWRVWATPRAAV